MANEAVGIDTGTEPSKGPLGFSWPVILGGLGVVVLGILVLRSRQGSSTSGNPLATSVMLADIQGAQDTLRGEIQVQGQQTREAVSGVAGQITDLTGLTTAGFAEAAQQRADFYAQLSTQFGALTAADAQHYSDLAAAIASSEARLVGLGQDTQSQNASYWTQVYLQLTDYFNRLSGQIGSLPTGPPPGPPTGPRPEDWQSWDKWYQGWQSAFGMIGANNPFDVNRDNIVDVRDYGLGRLAWKVQ